jgi:3-oxoadipate enol-lactonase
MQIADLGHVKLNWREDGNPHGKPVVFANSLGTDLRLWDQVIPLLPPQLRYLRYDKRGHGLSSCPPAPYSIDDLVADAAGFLDQLKVSDCIVVGLSIGGMIAQGLAATRPDLVRALVLSNTAAKMGDEASWDARIATVSQGGIAALADPILERWFSAAFRQSVAIEAWRNMLIRTPVEGYIGCCAAIASADLSTTTCGLTQPCLGIAGTEDGASPVALVQATIASIAGASFNVIDGVGHLPCVETPARYANLLTAFFKENGYD